MFQEQNSPSLLWIKGAALGILTYLPMVAMRFIPAIQPILLLLYYFMLILFSTVGLRWGKEGLFGALISLFLCFMVGNFGSQGFIVQYILFAIPEWLFPAVLSISSFLSGTKFTRRFEALAFCCGGSIFALLGKTIAENIIHGVNYFALISEYLVNNIEESLKLTAEITGNSLAYENAAAQAKALQVTFPAAFFFICIIFGVLVFYWSERCGEKSKRLAHRFVPFREWRIPKSFLWGIFCIFIFVTVGNAMDWPNFDAVSLVITLLIYFAYGLQGWAVMMYIRFAYAKSSITVFAILVVLFTMGFPFIMLGFIEHFLQLRRRLNQKIIIGSLQKNNFNNKNDSNFDNKDGHHDNNA